METESIARSKDDDKFGCDRDGGGGRSDEGGRSNCGGSRCRERGAVRGPVAARGGMSGHDFREVGPLGRGLAVSTGPPSGCADV